MKKLPFFLPILLLVVVATSCKKDKPIEPLPPAPVTYPDYSQLKVGNYWIYQHYDIDANGNVTPTNVFDTCRVEKDTVINGNTFYKVYRPYWYVSAMPELNYQVIRDSLHYIVKSNGEILFSSQDFTSVFRERYEFVGLNDTLCHVVRKMSDKDVTINTPAGDFITSNNLETYYMYPNWSMGGNIRYKHMRFAENIGIVAETYSFFVGSSNYRERRLVSYHLN